MQQKYSVLQYPIMFSLGGGLPGPPQSNSREEGEFNKSCEFVRELQRSYKNRLEQTSPLVKVQTSSAPAGNYNIQ